jgi:hypothetical protein
VPAAAARTWEERQAIDRRSCAEQSSTNRSPSQAAQNSRARHLGVHGSHPNATDRSSRLVRTSTAVASHSPFMNGSVSGETDMDSLSREFGPPTPFRGQTPDTPCNLWTSRRGPAARTRPRSACTTAGRDCLIPMGQVLEGWRRGAYSGCLQRRRGEKVPDDARSPVSTFDASRRASRAVAQFWRGRAVAFA